MRVNLDEDLVGLSNTEFENNTQRSEFITERMLNGMSRVVSASLDYLYASWPAESDELSSMPQIELESFLSMALAIKLIDRQRVLAGNSVMSALLRKKLETQGLS